MKRLRLLFAAVASVLLARCGEGARLLRSNSARPTVPPLSGRQPTRTAGLPEPSPEESQCGVIIIRTGVRPDQAGWGPSAFQAAYNLPSSSKGSGQIVAIVDAYETRTSLQIRRISFVLRPVAGKLQQVQSGRTTWQLPPDLSESTTGVSKLISTLRWFPPSVRTARFI